MYWLQTDDPVKKTVTQPLMGELFNEKIRENLHLLPDYFPNKIDNNRPTIYFGELVQWLSQFFSVWWQWLLPADKIMLFPGIASIIINLAYSIKLMIIPINLLNFVEHNFVESA